MRTDPKLLESFAERAGMTSLLNHGAASCVYSEGCAGVTQEHLTRFCEIVTAYAVESIAQMLQPPVSLSSEVPPSFLASDWVMEVAGVLVKLDEWEPGAVTARDYFHDRVLHGSTKGESTNG